MTPAKIISGILAVFFGTCTFAQDGTKVTEMQYQLPKCTVPIASLVVGKLVCKAASCVPVAPDPTGLGALIRMAGNGDKQPINFANFGEGMGAMLVTALKSTNCFDIQEREAMDELAKELALVGKKVDVQQADFMISGSITSLNMMTEKKQLGGGFIPVIGLFSSTTKTADLGLDIKVIDVNRAKIIDSRTFMANNETTSMSFGAVGFGGIGLLAGGMSSYKDTPLEPIIRDILAQVASFAATKLVNLKGAAAPVAVTAGPSELPAAK
jgi:curli biogenesis system outer membrane secretion channel CsgG